MKRITLITTILGALIFVSGTIVLMAAIAGNGAEETRTAGMLAMSFAGMMIAVPLYIDARRLQEKHKHTQAAAGAKGRPATRCNACGAPSARFWCTTHMQPFCPECVPKHDEPKSCLYKSLVHVAAKAKRA